MKLKIKHFDASVFKKKMEHLKDIEFTLFVDDIPTSQEDLSEINVLVLQEPDEYFGLHNWAIIQIIPHFYHLGILGSNQMIIS